MKRTTLAILLVVAAAALWVEAAAQSESVTNVKDEAEKVKEKAQDATHSWVGWAYEKFTTGLKMNAEKATDTGGDVKDAAKTSTNIMNDAAIDSSSYAAEKAADLKNSAGETIQMATEKAENAQAEANDKIDQAADVAGDVYNQAKEKAEL